ncbi:hypothetical protein [Methylobacterium sp. J-090]|uniref:hypothetical protein n=1 Tax=Methylobacterium sp. J-090 TaxID=2836666 RepID=UPI001FB94781|nr:hypothetical protein [Methylobacterium sp. J-090]MCJ2083251.1 hypothetical protein [Methylobacterium sp. J-090]
MTTYRDTPLSPRIASTDTALEVARAPPREPRTSFARADADGATAFAAERRLLRESYAKEPRRGGIGWKIGLVVDVALLCLPIPAVIVIPPLLECRHTAIHVGFFAGDSFEACARRRIVARWNHLDSRMKMIVRNSGQ